MVVFQNKIIYMPGLPPNARWEKIEDYKSQSGGIVWREERIKSLDGTRIALCVADVETASNRLRTESARTVYVVYCQGNASSTPPRLPLLSPIVKSLQHDSTAFMRYVVVCVSYRGYWTSKGRPSETGIMQDVAAAMHWIGSREDDTREATGSIPVILWGQSIGAGVASNLAARADDLPRHLQVVSLILETPFTNMRDMLVALYPQRWLPYRYLWPFLRNHLDSLQALDRLACMGREPPKIVIIQAGKDELVPTEHADELVRRCAGLGLPVEKHVIANALHNEGMGLQSGRKVISRAIIEAAQRDGRLLSVYGVQHDSHRM